MRISCSSQARRFRPNVLRPDLRPAEKETLLGRKTVDVLRSRLSLQRLLIRCVRHRQSSEVGHGFANNQLSLLMQSRLDFIRVKLLDHTICASSELLIVIVRPPHDKVTIGVESSALIVKAMRHFMANHSPDAAVVKSVVGLRIIEWRLQDAGRKDYLVVLRILASVDGR